MNESKELSIGFIYSTNCTICSKATLNESCEWDILIGILLGIIFTILLISVGAIIARIRQGARLRRTSTIRDHLNSLC